MFKVRTVTPVALLTQYYALNTTIDYVSLDVFCNEAMNPELAFPSSLPNLLIETLLGQVEGHELEVLRAWPWDSHWCVSVFTIENNHWCNATSGILPEACRQGSNLRGRHFLSCNALAP